MIQRCINSFKFDETDSLHLWECCSDAQVTFSLYFDKVVTNVITTLILSLDSLKKCCCNMSDLDSFTDFQLINCNVIQWICNFICFLVQSLLNDFFLKSYFEMYIIIWIHIDFMIDNDSWVKVNASDNHDFFKRCLIIWLIKYWNADFNFDIMFDESLIIFFDDFDVFNWSEWFFTCFRFEFCCICVWVRWNYNKLFSEIASLLIH